METRHATFLSDKYENKRRINDLLGFQNSCIFESCVASQHTAPVMFEEDIRMDFGPKGLVQIYL